uniref:Putative product n=1 Tax=Xenopsylla cheopis TaxID=163159 RepID=A0A6M2DPK5_XENCH
MILSQIYSIWFVLALSVSRLSSLFSFLYMILFVFLNFLRSSIFFSISCVTHGFLAGFSNFRRYVSTSPEIYLLLFPILYRRQFHRHFPCLRFSVCGILSPFPF